MDEIISAQNEANRLLQAEVVRLRDALSAAAYALFQLKRTVPEAVPAFAKEAHEKACAVLNDVPDLPKDRVEFATTDALFLFVGWTTLRTAPSPTLDNPSLKAD